MDLLLRWLSPSHLFSKTRSLGAYSFQSPQLSLKVIGVRRHFLLKGNPKSYFYLKGTRTLLSHPRNPNPTFTQRNPGHARFVVLEQTQEFESPLLRPQQQPLLCTDLYDNEGNILPGRNSSLQWENEVFGPVYDQLLVAHNKKRLTAKLKSELAQKFQLTEKQILAISHRRSDRSQDRSNRKKRNQSNNDNNRDKKNKKQKTTTNFNTRYFFFMIFF